MRLFIHDPNLAPGTKLKRVIHKVVDLTPLPAKAKRVIKECGACTDREKWINDQHVKFMEKLTERRARAANRRPADPGPGRSAG